MVISGRLIVHAPAGAELIPFGAMYHGKRLEEVHTFKSAAASGAAYAAQAGGESEEVEARSSIDIASWAGRNGGVMLCRDCLDHGMDR